MDELIDFITAAEGTTQASSQVIASHWIKDKKSLEKVRAEFDAYVAGCDGKIEDVMKEKVTLDSINEL